MDHIAFMTKKYKLIDKILTGEKKVESRWYVNKIAPWNKINVGDTIYFKNSGEKVTAKAGVKKVLQFSNINKTTAKALFELDRDQSKTILEILTKYGKLISFSNSDYKKFAYENTNKNYCILIYLSDPQKIEPFQINKSGYGNACAWICIDSVNSIKLQSDKD